MVCIIPLGINCSLAETLKKIGKRNISHPLDWVVSFGGISKLFQKKFEGFIPVKKYKYPNNDEFFWSEDFGIVFRHDNFPESTEKYQRRIDRLLNLLSTTTEHVVFVRKCHQHSHHQEVSHHNILYDNDIKDIIEFDKIIKKITLTYHTILC